MNSTLLTAALAVGFGMTQEKFKAAAKQSGLSGKRARKLFLRAKRSLRASSQ
jgi:hypothetical protein